MKQAIELLGHKVQDKVSGVVGVVTSVSFDLYGCVQAIVAPPAKEDGTRVEGWWTDINRLDVIPGERVMTPPDFAKMDGRKPTPSSIPGPAEKPLGHN